jgi:hypothetical protein
MTIYLGGQTYYLSVLQNCDDENRFNEWQATGGALLNNRNLGCGINSLTYLGIFTRQQGEGLVNVVNARGTTFDEMMNYVFNRNGGNPQYRMPASIRTVDHVQHFIDHLTNILCEGCCTVAKLMRYPDNYQNPPLCHGEALTSGHTIVFSKNGGILYATDPQQGTRRRSDNAAAAFAAWQRNCYREVHLMFNIQPDYRHTVPMDIDDAANVLPDHGPIDDRTQIDNGDTVPMDIDGGKTKNSKQSKKSKKGKKSKRAKKSKKSITKRNKQ